MSMRSFFFGGSPLYIDDDDYSSIVIPEQERVPREIARFSETAGARAPYADDHSKLFILSSRAPTVILKF